MATSVIKVRPNITGADAFSTIAFGVYPISQADGKLFEINLTRREDGKNLLVIFTEQKLLFRTNRNGIWETIWEK